jgi:LysR family transcriptional regulator, hydrogen peroxide-inducible genes activator
MSRQPTLKQLKYLLAVADAGHFGQAAKACFVSQSTLSAGIAELEDLLGVVLLERTHRNILLTDIGKDVVARARSTLLDVEDMLAVCDASQEPFTGRMRLGVIPTIAPFVLPNLMKMLRERHPRFQLLIKEDLSGHLLEALYRGELDVLLLALPFEADSVDTSRLYRDKFWFACSQQHNLSHQAQLTAEDLRGQDLLLLEDGHCLRDHVLQACNLELKDVSLPFQATSLNTIVQMVASGIGVTLLPNMAVGGSLLAGVDLCLKPFGAETISRDIGLMWRKKSPRVQDYEALGAMIVESKDSGAA